MRIDARLNEEVFVNNPYNPGDFDDPLFFPPDPDPNNPLGPPLPTPEDPVRRPRGFHPDDPWIWDPDYPGRLPDLPPDLPGGINPPSDWDPDLPTPKKGSRGHWYLRWINAWREYYTQMIANIQDEISRLITQRGDLIEQLEDLEDNGLDNSPDGQRLRRAISSLGERIQFLRGQILGIQKLLDDILRAISQWWSIYRRGLRPSIWKSIKKGFRKWLQRRSRRRPPFPPRRRGPPGSASVDEIWDSIFADDFSDSRSYTGLQWAVIIEAMFLDGIGGSGYTSGDQSESNLFQGMIDSVYEFFTEFNDPNQTYSYDDFIAILDGWIQDAEDYNEGNPPFDPPEPQGLQDPQRDKLNINVSSTPTTPTITPSASPPPTGGQGASPEGEFAKAFARYNNKTKGYRQ